MKPKKQNKTAYIYIRVGSRQQTMEGISLDAQKETIKNYCRENNIRIVDVFSDYPESANNFNRCGFVRMLGRNVIRPVNYILATGLDRISRNIGEYINLKNQLSKLGTHFLFPNTVPSGFLEEIIKTMDVWCSVVKKKRGDCD